MVVGKLVGFAKVMLASRINKGVVLFVKENGSTNKTQSLSKWKFLTFHTVGFRDERCNDL